MLKGNLILPSPGNISRKSTTDQGTQDTSDTKDGTNHGSVICSLLGLRNESDDCIGTGTNTRGPNARNGTAYDEGYRRRGHSTNHTSDFEDEDGCQEAQLKGEVLIDLAPC
jgi:hypothetical protein